MNLLKQIRHKLPGLALLSAAFLFCGSAGRACDPDDIDHMLDPENLDMSSRPLEGIVSIQEIITLRRGTDKEVLVPAMYTDDLCLNKNVLLEFLDFGVRGNDRFVLLALLVEVMNGHLIVIFI